MLKTSIFLILLFLLHGCNYNTPFLTDEINQVTVVKYAPYFKHHRAYFTRSKLQAIENKKYIFLHNPKKNELGVLLHYKDKYILYNMSQPEQKPYIIRTKKIYTQEKILKSFASKGYRAVKSVADVGYITSVSHKLYKGIKTLLIEVKDYSKLQARYKKAIKTYNPSYIKYINTKLPKSLIRYYYNYYKKHTKSKSKIHQLQIIGEKLHIDKVEKIKKLPQKISKKSKFCSKKIKSIPNAVSKPVIKEEKPIIVSTSYSKKPNTYISSSVTDSKPYSYYLSNAPLQELSSYLSSQTTQNTLSDSQYVVLKLRQERLEEEKLLDKGTLEELIAAYKINKKPAYKERIMILMKEKQEAD